MNEAIGVDRTVAVVGTGTMGQGIAQVALAAGHSVRLHDSAPGRAAEAVAAIGARLDRLVEKGRMTAADREAAAGRLHAAADLAELADAALVVEAIVEDLAVKQRLFADLEAVVADDALLATNTSSLSVTAIAGGLRLPGRFVGLHFFNPAPLLPLVEVVRGFASDETAATRAYETVKAWGKTPVRCADTPGFIVNRIARPFYAEAFRVYEEGGADPATIDAVLRESGGFRMGPFELTDLIGQDVNEAVTRSVWDSFFQDPKFTPSLAQRRLVESGRLGRKSGHGWYPYAEGAERPEPHTAPPAKAPERIAVHGDLGPAQALVGLFEEAGIRVEREEGDGRVVLPSGAELHLADGETSFQYQKEIVYFDLALDYAAAGRIALSAQEGIAPEVLGEAVGLFQALGKQVSVIGDVPGMIVARTVAMLVDLAADAVDRGVATAEDIDTAMRLGVNYPAGPLEWGARLGHRRAAMLLDELHDRYPTGRYAPCLGLARRAYAEEER
ncbi:3-hydroxyacyl-CoA dehydrogenase [Streptomyces sp. R302]|uniref:3-hydroxyacyl-CoA dehydrogenase n=1 Tax=unclassified Streptomyces TaxID=2593676 RepID=UPI00145FB3EC|nr:MULTISPECIES: 3-hydroxyacyl-CoA dehydrogenase [unclassified Streptomyces]NML52384.1 3-hydroxyacyl-CoA dehydrogenase [Streptomyces sp. R301]NML82150.1 3-hydroxyacyl-CoA dehydrogenase [Streptomyces sp. R302]